MGKPPKLLSIGEMSKLTGVGIKALRYYERINVMKPSYVDPDSSYRYYSFNQVYLIELIKFALELDIPLKKLDKFINAQGTMDFKSFSAYGKKVVAEKIKTLERATRFFDFVDKELAVQSKYPVGEIYTRQIPQKNFYVIPYKETFENIDQYEMSKMFLDMPNLENYEDENELLEYGFLYERTPTVVQRYVFVELPESETKYDSRVIPAGKYHCFQGDGNRIEQITEVFGDYISDGDSFIAVETEVFSFETNLSSPLNELRVLVM
jgi:DNA-binding transcriptional MerR regulator